MKMFIVRGSTSVAGSLRLDHSGLNSACDTSRKLQPRGKKYRSSPLAFSLQPLCHGLCGSAKKMGALSCSSNSRSSANSDPLSRDRLFTGLSFSASTIALLVSHACLECTTHPQIRPLFRSTSVTAPPFPSPPHSVSPSQSPIRSLCRISSYYIRVVFIDLSPEVCYTVGDAVDWFVSPTARRFEGGSNHSPLSDC